MMYGRGFGGFRGCFDGLGMYPGSMGFFMMLGRALLVIVVVFFWVRKGKASTQTNDAEHILKLRLAKGEISNEEYDKLKKIL